jgi:hypothetical protein
LRTVLRSGRGGRPLSTTWTTRLRLEPIDVGRVEDFWLLYQDPGIAARDGGTWSRTTSGRER